MNSTDIELHESISLEEDYRYGQICYFSNDTVIGKAIHFYGEWAQIEIDLLRSLLSENDVVLDVGANIGSHSIAFSEKVGPKGHIFSFEPASDTFGLLEKNIALNSLKNVTLFQFGLGAENNKYFLNSYSKQSEANFGSASISKNQDQECEEVKVNRLDDLDIPRCHLIKIDVEGMEADVLSGGMKKIDCDRPIIYFECNDADAGWKAIKLLQDLKYTFYLHRALAHNVDNFKNCKDSLFGLSFETNIMSIPFDALNKINPSEGETLVRINSRDDLKTAMDETPRYGDLALLEQSRLRVIKDLTVLRISYDRLKQDMLNLEKQKNYDPPESNQQLAEEFNRFRKRYTERETKLSALLDIALNQQPE